MVVVLVVVVVTGVSTIRLFLFFLKGILLSLLLLLVVADDRDLSSGDTTSTTAISDTAGIGIVSIILAFFEGDGKITEFFSTTAAVTASIDCSFVIVKEISLLLLFLGILLLSVITIDTFTALPIVAAVIVVEVIAGGLGTGVMDMVLTLGHL